MILIINQLNVIEMEKKKIKKLALKKETISNLSKFEQGGIIGGYAASNGLMFFCALRSLILTDCDNNFNCLNTDLLDKKQTIPNDGGTCDSTIDWDVTCTGNC